MPKLTSLGDALLALSLPHIRLFIDKYGSGFYGFGFFCDASNGLVYLVANSEEFHQESFNNMLSLMNTANEDQFKWDIGNWQFPAGLFPSASAEQRQFERGWVEIRNKSPELTQKDLEKCCKAVLMKLHGISDSPLAGIEGLIVLGPDDSNNDIVTKRVLVKN
jgi:hypothetical protein